MIVEKVQRQANYSYFRILLRDLAKVLPITCQLDGFDISDVMFPNDTGLPSNVSFRFQNLLGKFHPEYIGTYDVVNVRVMVLALSSHEWEPAIRNLMTLLRKKPATFKLDSD